jgi:tRNA-2-methylthio-N6-dimethylallyladenosine synthase
MAKHKNICKYLHLPVQSGSNAMLKAMNRQHTREEYMELIDNIYKIIPEMSLSQDMIVGFCGETEEDHQDTLALMKYVKYDFGFMFTYSERPGTLAGNKMEDDVPHSVKKRRLQEIIDLQQEHALYRTQQHLGKIEEFLIEGTSKKNPDEWKARNTQNTIAVFKKGDYKLGDFVNVKVEDCTSATLKGTVVGYSDNN